VVTVPEKPSLARRIEREIRRFRKRHSTNSLLKEALQRLDQQILQLAQATLDMSEAIPLKLNELRSEIPPKLNELRNELRAEVLAELSFSFHDQAELLADLKASLNEISHQEAEIKNMMTQVNFSLTEIKMAINNETFEIKNTVTHFNTSVHSRLNNFENVNLVTFSERIHALTAVQLEILNLTDGHSGKGAPHLEERYQRASPRPWPAILDRAKQEFPRIFPLWKERLDATAKAFRHTKVGNAARPGDVYSRAFRSLVERCAHGRVLDVGCGVFGRPYYLSAYRGELISGIDPLKPEAPPDFEFVQGISEYLPWPDGSFSTVISATSLDHSMSLDRSLAEIRRVLVPEGCFLLWLGSNPGSPKYDPDSAAFVAADDFHLFHFDVSWFEPMLLEEFELVDRYEFDRVGYSHLLYCLRRRVGAQSP
jgi:SAM-dependent methyltransferase